MSKKIIFSVLCVSVLLTACNSVKESVEKTKPWVAQHVVFIGLDGWSASSYEKAEMPVTKGLAADGAYTVKKRSVLPSSSAVNWATMFNGSAPELHGYTKWDSKTPDVPSRVVSHYGLFPSVFGLFHDAYPQAKSGLLYEWDGIGYFVEKESFDIIQNLKPDSLTLVGCDYIKQSKPALFAMIYDDPDHTGHGFGWDSPEYYEKLKELDGRVNQIVQAVKDAGIYDETVFIITSDHGGINKGHGGATLSEMEAPFVVSGKGIKKGLNFDDISIMQYDVAATIATIFRLEQPQVWTGRSPKQIFIQP
jgi:predicted AlkP superfamily pyrophosphatase or phosphodiesterase